LECFCRNKPASLPACLFSFFIIAFFRAEVSSKLELIYCFWVPILCSRLLLPFFFFFFSSLSLLLSKGVTLYWTYLAIFVVCC
jgi:hypothetical protein